MLLRLPMARKGKEPGSLNSQGGILLSVLLAIFLFSFLLLNLSLSYQQTVDLVDRTQDLYRAKIAKELFLADYKNESTENGVWKFNQGELSYQKEGKQVKMTVKIKKKIYHFSEKINTSNALE